MANFLKITFFLIIIIGAGIWFAMNEPALFHSSPAEKISVSAPKNQISTPTVRVNPPAQTQQPRQPEQISDYSIPAGYTRAQLSPYFQKIRISSAYASAYSGFPSQIQLYSSSLGDQKIDITNWVIKTNKKDLTIPTAVNLFDLSGLMGNSDIIVSSNSYISLYSNTSAVNRNIRLNKCAGYLKNNYNFVPQLPRNCPSIPRSTFQNLSGQCQNYLFSFGGSCKIPDVSFYNSLPGNDDGNACRAFLSNINYNSCVRDHRNDSDFYQNDWRVWVNQNILDPQHDTVRLFDTQGLLVDQYIY